MKKAAFIGIVLLTGFSAGAYEVIYSNNFSGVNGSGKTNPDRAADIAASAESGSNLLHSTAGVFMDGAGGLTSAGAANGLFVQLSDSPLTGTEVTVNWTIKAPGAGGWIGAGFSESADRLNAGESTGPWVRTTPTATFFYGGTKLGFEATFTNRHSAGDILNYSMTYYFADQTIDLLLNGEKLIDNVPFIHEDSVGMQSIPVVQYLSITFHTVSNSWMDSISVSGILEPPPRSGFLFEILAEPITVLNPPKWITAYEWTNLTYKTVNQQKLDLILLYPSVKKYTNAPVVMYIHGGSWKSGDRFGIGLFRTPAEHLLAEGIAVASIDYRLLGAGAGSVEDCVIDSKDAARFLMKNAAALGLDTNNFGISGHSAGAHLSMMVTLAPNNLFPGDAALLSTDPEYKCGVASAPVTSRPDEKISPVKYITSNSPPMLLVHGIQDPTVPVASTTYAIEVAEQCGAPLEKLLIDNADHMFNAVNSSQPQTPPIAEVYRSIADYFIEKFSE